MCLQYRENISMQILHLFSVTVSYPDCAASCCLTANSQRVVKGTGTPRSPSSPAGVKSGPPGPGASLGLSVMTRTVLLLLLSLSHGWTHCSGKTAASLSITVEWPHFQCLWEWSHVITETLAMVHKHELWRIMHTCLATEKWAKSENNAE